MNRARKVRSSRHPVMVPKSRDRYARPTYNQRGSQFMSPTLDILFEDDALIFINKPAGVVVQQRMHQPDEPYLHADVARHTSPAYLMQRLDRGTSGVMFFSKRAD